MNLPCTVCEAPVPVYEYKEHLKACIKINVGHPSPATKHPSQLAYEDRVAAFQRNAMMNMPAWSPETVTQGGTPPIPDALARAQSDAVTPSTKADWYKKNQSAPVPDGRAQCLACNGLTLMYPNCGACDGRGWV